MSNTENCQLGLANGWSHSEDLIPNMTVQDNTMRKHESNEAHNDTEVGKRHSVYMPMQGTIGAQTDFQAILFCTHGVTNADIRHIAQVFNWHTKSVFTFITMRQFHLQHTNQPCALIALHSK